MLTRALCFETFLLLLMIDYGATNELFSSCDGTEDRDNVLLPMVICIYHFYQVQVLEVLLCGMLA